MTKPEFTERQRQIVALIARGHTNDEIADTLGISGSTAKNHVDVVRRKLHVERRRQIPQAYTTQTGVVASTLEVAA